MNHFYKYLLISLLLISCESSSQEIDLRDYYFQLEKFKTPVVYKYEDPNNKDETQYWEFSSNLNSKELMTKTYNSEVELIELFIEKFTDTGSELIVYQPIEDSIPTITKIRNKEVYNWNSQKDCKYTVEFLDSRNGNTIFEKERKFIGKEVITILNEKKESIKFKGVYLFKFLDYNQEFEYYQYSYYVKGYGFVRYDRYFPDGKKSQLILTKIFTED